MRPILTILLFCAAVMQSSGNDNIFQYERLSVSDGLGNMITRATAQTSNGLIWFATYSGIQSYDGFTFKTYNINGMHGQHGDDNRFTGIVAKEDTLWCSTFKEVFSYDPIEDSFSCIFNTDGVNSKVVINALDIIFDKYLFISTNNGLFVYNTLGAPVTSFKSGECFGAVSLGNTIYTATSGGVISFSEKLIQSGSKPLFTDKRITFIDTDGRGNLWLQPFGEHLYCLAKGKTVRNTEQVNKLIQKNIVRDIIIYDDTYLIAIDGLGIIYCDMDLSPTMQNEFENIEMNSLSDETVYNLFRDSNNYLWLSTFTGGVNYINPTSSGFMHFGPSSSSGRGLSRPNIRAIYPDSEGRLWFGHKNGISVCDPSTGEWQHNDNLTSNTVLALNQDLSGNIWAAAFSDGVYICDKGLNIVNCLNIRNSSISTDEIFVIYRDSDGYMWLSGEDGSLTRVSVPDMHTSTYLIDNVARSIIETDKHELVIAGSDGVGAFNRHTGGYRRIFPHAQYGASTLMAYSVLQGEDGNLIVATEGRGVLTIDFNGNILNRTTTDNGLVSNAIYGMESDSEDNIWCSSSRGIVSIEHKRRENHQLLDFSGLRVDGYMYCSHTKTRNGEIVFGGIGGATLVIPGKVYFGKTGNSIYFDNLYISNKKVTARPKSAISAQINNCDRIDLKYNQNNISISFRSIQPAGNFPDLFDWILEGYSTDWVYSSSTRTLDFVNLPPGKYILKIRSALTPEYVSRQLPIIVHVPWWKTWWAFLIWTALFGCLVFLVGNYLHNILKTKISENKVKVFATLAHDIKNPLSVIRLLLGNIYNSLPQQDDTKLKTEVNLVMEHSNKITGIINRLLEIETASDMEVPLRVAKYRLEASIQGFMSEFESLIKEKGLEVSYDFPDTPTWVWFDMNILQHIIQNLVDNAIKYTPAGGRITISTERFEKECVISIADTGIGIPEQEKSKIFKGYFRASNAVKSVADGTGIGLVMVRQLLKKMQGNVRFTSKEGTGSTFSISLPLGNKHIDEVNLISPYSQNKISSDHKNLKILIAEDNLELQNIITEHLNGIYTIFAANDGAEAMTQIRKDMPDIIITDYMMPVMNGIELAKQIKSDSQLKHIPIIMLTALTSNKSKVTGYDAGVDAIIEKPFDMDVLLSRIENLLNNSSYSHNEMSPEVRESELLTMFRSLVMDRLSDSEFNMESICRQMDMGYTDKLYKKIKTLTGKSPIDLITEIRLQQADEYFKTKKYTVQQVCYMTGFSSPSYFTKVYKRHFGVTPSQKSDL